MKIYLAGEMKSGWQDLFAAQALPDWGCRAILIEREEEYQADIRRRMSLVLGGPEERQREIVKAKGFTGRSRPALCLE